MTLLPGSYDLLVIQGSAQTEGFRLEQDDGTLVDTTGWLARATIRQTADGAQLFHMSTGNGRITVGYDPAPWDNATAYAVGDHLIPSTPNGFVYVVTDAGTSGASEPTWPTTIGDDVTADGVTYECLAADDDYLTNLRIGLTPSDTSPLADWGYGYWDLEVIDDFDNVYRILGGNAYMSREITQEA